MPNHLHILLTVGRDMTIEKAMQLIKGGFSYRLKKESGYLFLTGGGSVAAWLLRSANHGPAGFFAVPGVQRQ